MEKERKKIWFTSDLHFSHFNIVKYTTKRSSEFNLDITDADMLTKHDKSIIDRWNETVNKKDVVYILGDFSFASPEETKKILGKLNGEKHLIIGNHDGSCRTLGNYFESVSHIKEVSFKKTLFPFLEENIHCVMCHFPMIAWNRRMSGSIMLHGHTHGSICELNKLSEELRLDIGFDSEIGGCNLVEIEEIYNYLKKNVTKGKTFKEHINYLVEKTGLRA